YDFFSVDFTFDDNRHMHSMCRQIDGCVNNVSELIFGTKGYSNAQNKIWDYDGNLLWEYQYPLGDDGEPTNRVAVSPYDQEHIDLVAAIRNGEYINESQNVAQSVMTAMMGRISAYTGREVTWEEIMDSSLKLGPDEYEWGPVDIPAVPPTPGTAPA
ncbi:MAG: hypothetical protein ACOCU3_01865, partial [bacterium]